MKKMNQRSLDIDREKKKKRKKISVYSNPRLTSPSFELWVYSSQIVKDFFKQMTL